MKFRSRFAVVGTLLAVALALLVSLPALALDSTTSVTAGTSLTISVHADDTDAPAEANAADTKVLNPGGGTTVWVAANSSAFNRVWVQVGTTESLDKIAVSNASTRKSVRIARSEVDGDGNTLYRTAAGDTGTITALAPETGEDDVMVKRVIEYVEAPATEGLLQTNAQYVFIVVTSEAASVPSTFANEEFAIAAGATDARHASDSGVGPIYFLVAGNNDEIKVTATGTVADGDDPDSEPDPFSVSNDFSLKVDSQGPRISAISPAGGANQSSDSATFGATFTDPGSGFVTDAEQAAYVPGASTDTDGDDDLITKSEPLALGTPTGAARDININVFKASSPAGAPTSPFGFAHASDITSKGSSSWRETADGFTVSIVESPLGVTTGGGVVYYAFQAKDRVGNVTISGLGGPNNMQNHQLIIDRASPEISDALAGRGYKASATSPDDDAADLKSIKLVFSGGIVDSDIETLDTTTIEASDFTVVGADGTEMEVTGVNTSPLPAPTEANPDATVNNVVYLELANDLPPAATPRVSVVGLISDLAGNRLGAGAKGSSLVATDKTSPVFDVSVSGSVAERVAATGERTDQVTIRIVANEGLRNVPTLRVASLVPDGTAIEIGNPNALSGKAPVAVQGVDNTWELTTQVTDSGLYAVYVTGEDTSPDPNPGGTPVPDAETVIDADTLEKLTLFEIDDSVALGPATGDDLVTAFALTPRTTADVTQTINPFIRINFAEASEYPHDTHKSVSLTKLVLRNADAEESDLLGTEGRVDSDSFLVSLNDLALGEYTLIVNGTDELGNTLSRNAEFDFTVKQRPAHDVRLWPGNNLVSVPGEPVDPSIDEVLPASHPATAVLAYDPTSPVGPWLAATRDAGGTWSGPLTEINQGKGYWIDTSTFQALSVQLRERGSGEVPPTFPVTAGWNLIGVVAASNDALNESVAAKDYLASINWSVAYTYNTGSNDWTKITATTMETVTVDGQEVTRPSTLTPGQGVWVWAETADVLAP